MRLIEPHIFAIATIWQEARNQPYTGKIAVAEVIRERMKHKYFSDGTIEGTVLRPYQFSGWNTQDPNRLVSVRLDDTDSLVQQCIKAWEDSATSKLTDGALHYCNKNISDPPWATDDKFIKKIGDHSFYRR